VVALWIVAHSGTTYNYGLLEEPSSISWHGLAIATGEKARNMLQHTLCASFGGIIGTERLRRLEMQEVDFPKGFVWGCATASYQI
jgi:hypothetical protein